MAMEAVEARQAAGVNSDSEAEPDEPLGTPPVGAQPMSTQLVRKQPGGRQAVGRQAKRGGTMVVAPLTMARQTFCEVLSSGDGASGTGSQGVHGMAAVREMLREYRLDQARALDMSHE